MNDLPSLRRSLFLCSQSCLRTALWLSVLHASGCGGRTSIEQSYLSVPNVDLEKSVQRAGTRLVPLAWISDDGPAISSRRLLDLKRNEHCKFALADDGTYRCFPLAVTSRLSATWLATFANDKCTDVVMRESSVRVYPLEFPMNPRPLYFALVDARGCDTGRQIFRLTPPNSSAVYTSEDGACKEVGTESYYAPGTRLANSEFASGMDTVASLHEEKLGLHQMTSEDGAAAIVGFYDRSDNTACEPLRLSDTETRCVGSPILQPSSFDTTRLVDVDVRCSTIVAGASQCASPRYGVVVDNDVTTIHHVTALSELREPSSTQLACMNAISQTSGTNGYAITDEVPVERFARLGFRTEETRIRSRNPRATGAQGLVSVPKFDDEPLDLIDSSSGAQCTLMPATDGKMRCLPNWLQKLSYAKAGCTEQLVESDSDGVPRPYYTLGRSGEAHPVVTAGAPYSGTVYEVDFVDTTDGSCKSTSVHSTASWYRIGPEVPPDRFVEYRLEEMR